MPEIVWLKLFLKCKFKVRITFCAHLRESYLLVMHVLFIDFYLVAVS